LLSEAARLAAAQQLRVFTTTGVQSEAQIAFAGLYQLLRPVLDQVDRLPERSGAPCWRRSAGPTRLSPICT
jgi:hypothetical protein